MQNIRAVSAMGMHDLLVEDGRGIINDEAVTCFTRGQCHAFAVALHDETGWPIIGIGGYPESPSHFVVYSPKIDDFVDIEGPGALRRDGGEHYQMLKEFDKKEAIRPRLYMPPNYEAARPFVKTVLEEIEAMPEQTRKKNGYLHLGKSF